MKPIIKAETSDGIVYGKLVGEFELVVDVSGGWYPGWIPDAEYYWYDAMETIDGRLLAVNTAIDGTLIAFEPEEDYSFFKGAGMIASNVYGQKRKKRGRHSNSANRKANRDRIYYLEELPF